MNVLMLFLAIFFSASLTAADMESVVIDNYEIHEYNGVVGKWMLVPNYNRMKELCRDFGVDEAEVKRLNPELKFGTYFFVPFSAEKQAALEAKGVFRKEMEISRDDFISPLPHIHGITSFLGQRWGAFHPGVDFPCPPMTPIVSTLDGRVILSKYIDGYGNCVIVEHRNGFITKYGHNSINLVRVGDVVKRGQIVAYSGNTGRSTGPHLHFEVRLNDIPLDPLDFMPDDQEMADAVDRAEKNRIGRRRR